MNKDLEAKAKENQVLADFLKLVEKLREEKKYEEGEFKALVQEVLQLTAVELSEVTGISISTCYKMFQSRAEVPEWLSYLLKETLHD